jgi:hypothetical protein
MFAPPMARYNVQSREGGGNKMAIITPVLDVKLHDGGGGGYGSRRTSVARSATLPIRVLRGAWHFSRLAYANWQQNGDFVSEKYIC